MIAECGSRIADCSLKQRVLEAARADMIPSAQLGLWTVAKVRLAKPVDAPRPGGKRVTVPPGSYTQLYRMTGEKLNTHYGELVMHDFPDELNTHLDFMLKAHGRVLITGLGLGCVARGCLANPQVRHVVVIERDPQVLELVGRYMGHPRLTIIVADAVEWCRRKVRKFDCAWHDLWSDPDKNEPHLQVTHAKLAVALTPHVRMQGAWAMDRNFKRRLPNFI